MGLIYILPSVIVILIGITLICVSLGFVTDRIFEKTENSFVNLAGTYLKNVMQFCLVSAGLLAGILLVSLPTIPIN